MQLETTCSMQIFWLLYGPHISPLEHVEVYASSQHSGAYPGLLDEGMSLSMSYSLNCLI